MVIPWRPGTDGGDALPLPKWGPMAESHPLVTMAIACVACEQPFVEGDVTTVVTIGPGDSEEQRKKARDGRPYTAIGRPAHWQCVTGETTEDTYRPGTFASDNTDTT